MKRRGEQRVTTEAPRAPGGAPSHQGALGPVDGGERVEHSGGQQGFLLVAAQSCI